jgi:hypothetical protein
MKITALQAILVCVLLLVSCKDDGDEQAAASIFTVNIVGNYLETESKGWVFLSKSDGTVVQTFKIANAGTYKLTAPADHRDGDLYTVTIFEHIQALSQTYSFKSYTSLNPGIVNFDKKNFPASVGTHSVSISNVPVSETPDKIASFGSFGINSQLSSGTQLGNSLSAKTRMFKSEDNIYYFYATADATVPKYTLFSGAKSGEGKVVDYNAMVPMENKVTLPVGDATKVSYRLSGFLDSNPDMPYFAMIISRMLSADKTISLYHPNFQFSNFMTTVDVQNNDLQNEYTFIGPSLPTVFKTSDAVISKAIVNQNEITLNISGNTDHVLAAAREEWSPNKTIYTNWELYAPKDLPAGYKLPQIPSEILTAYQHLSTHTFTFNRISLTDYSAIDGYANFVDVTLRQNKTVYQGSNEIMTKTFSY